MPDTLNFPAPLDPGFSPCIFAGKGGVEGQQDARLIIAVEGEDGRISRYETQIAAEPDAAALRRAERLVKMLLWARGGWRVIISGPPAVAEYVKARYCAGGERAFDADMMRRIYLQPLTVEAVAAGDVPASREHSASLPFCSASRLVLANSSSILRMPLSGVRISWLMLARNSVLA